jgi:hypothetical protein
VEVIEEVVEPVAGREMVDERLNRHAGAGEDRGSAEDVRRALDEVGMVGHRPTPLQAGRMVPHGPVRHTLA